MTINELSIIAIMIIVLSALLYRVLNKPAPGVISGGLKSGESPVIGATVTAYNSTGDEVGVATSDVNGMYALPPLTYGTYHITAILKNADGSWLQGDADVTVDAASVTADLTLVNTIVALIEDNTYENKIQ